MAAGDAGKAIFWHAPCLKERPFDSLGFSAEGTLIYASGVPTAGAVEKWFVADKLEFESTGKRDIIT